MARLNYPNKPLIRQDYVFFVRKGARTRFNGDFADLSAATLGVVMGVSYGQRFDDAAARGAFRKLEAASSYELIFRMLTGGRVDAVICSRLVGLEFVRRIGADGLIEISGPPVETALSYLVFSADKRNAALAPALRQGDPRYGERWHAEPDSCALRSPAEQAVSRDAHAPRLTAG